MFKIKVNYISVLVLLLIQHSYHAQELVNSDEFYDYNLTCPEDDDGSNPLHLPNPYDCSKFFKCDRGVPVEQDCPEGLEWSIKTNRCEWPSIAHCQYNGTVPNNNTTVEPSTTTEDNSTTVESSTTTDDNSTTVEPSTTTDDNSTTDEPSSTLPPSPNYLCEGKNNDLLPFPGECSKFVQCSNGLAISFDCPKGLHWDDAIKRCNYVEAANCNSQYDSYDNSNNNDDSSEDDIFKENEIFRPEQNLAPVHHPGCPANENPANPTQLPYPGDCSKFYKCNGGLAVPLQCPSGLHWNNALKVCDWPSNAQCNNVFFGSFAQVNVPVKHPHCPAYDNPASPSLLPYPGNCSKFYKCYNGYAYEQDCPSGLHWNKYLKVCDWINNVVC